MRGTGDTILAAGAATESFASSAAAVAEDAVRIAENLAGSLAASFSSEADFTVIPVSSGNYAGLAHDADVSAKQNGNYGMGEQREDEEDAWKTVHDWYDIPSDHRTGDDASSTRPPNSYVHHGTEGDGNTSDENQRGDEDRPMEGIRIRTLWNDAQEFVIVLWKIVYQEIMDFVDFSIVVATNSFSGTSGAGSNESGDVTAPTLGPDLFGVTIFCYLASLALILNWEKKEENRNSIHTDDYIGRDSEWKTKKERLLEEEEVPKAIVLKDQNGAETRCGDDFLQQEGQNNLEMSPLDGDLKKQEGKIFRKLNENRQSVSLKSIIAGTQHQVKSVDSDGTNKEIITESSTIIIDKSEGHNQNITFTSLSPSTQNGFRSVITTTSTAKQIVTLVLFRLWRAILLVGRLFLEVFTNRKVAFFLLNGFGWLYLCRSFHLRSIAIQR